MPAATALSTASRVSRKIAVADGRAHRRVADRQVGEGLEELARQEHEGAVVFLDEDAGRVVIGEGRVDGEADRRVERLRALQVGHRQVDEHHGHRGLPLVSRVMEVGWRATPTRRRGSRESGSPSARSRFGSGRGGSAAARREVFARHRRSSARSTSLSSSTTPAASSVCATEMLPWTPMSPPGRFFRSRTKSTSPPSIALAFAHSWSSGVDVATYFGTVLMNDANGSISLPGQNGAHSS